MTWWAIGVMGLATWAIRWSFLGLIGDRPLPDWLRRHLRYTGVAVMPGLVAPLVLTPAGGAVEAAALAGCAAALAVGVWRRDVMWAVGAGAAAYAAAALL